jgi:RimJ/RimL family protein N-acetyltransferase
VLEPAYPIETPRLLLRPFESGDFDDLFAILSHPEVARYLYGEPETADEVRESLARRIGRSAIAAEGDRLQLAVVPKAGSTMVGYVTLIWRSRAHRQGEIGFVFHPDHQGQGYAGEATEALLPLGFEGLRLHRIVGRCDARNGRSGRLLERLGMRLEAHLVENEFVKGEWADELVYAMLEREWWARQP